MRARHSAGSQRYLSDAPGLLCPCAVAGAKKVGAKEEDTYMTNAGIRKRVFASAGRITLYVMVLLALNGGALRMGTGSSLGIGSTTREPLPVRGRSRCS